MLATVRYRPKTSLAGCGALVRVPGRRRASFPVAKLALVHDDARPCRATGGPTMASNDKPARRADTTASGMAFERPIQERPKEPALRD